MYIRRSPVQKVMLVCVLSLLTSTASASIGSFFGSVVTTVVTTVTGNSGAGNSAGNVVSNITNNTPGGFIFNSLLGLGGGGGGTTVPQVGSGGSGGGGGGGGGPPTLALPTPPSLNGGVPGTPPGQINTTNGDINRTGLAAGSIGGGDSNQAQSLAANNMTNYNQGAAVLGGQSSQILNSTGSLQNQQAQFNQCGAVGPTMKYYMALSEAQKYNTNGGWPSCTTLFGPCFTKQTTAWNGTSALVYTCTNDSYGKNKPSTAALAGSGGQLPTFGTAANGVASVGAPVSTPGATASGTTPFPVFSVPPNPVSSAEAQAAANLQQQQQAVQQGAQQVLTPQLPKFSF